MNLQPYALIIVNSSGGKDSLCALWEVCRLADVQGVSRDRIVVSHQDLGRMEWKGTKELVQAQADFFGVKSYYSSRRNKDGHEENLLQYVVRRGKWPSSKQRYCTSDFKRAPGARVVTAITKDLGACQVLHVFGFRADESPARSKREPFSINVQLTTQRRKVFDWLPIHYWDSIRVWSTIKINKLPYHWAYDLGMPRLSCIFCIFSPFDALVIAGRENPELLDEYIAVERQIGHTFRAGFAIESVREAIQQGYMPAKAKDWVM